LKFMTERFLSGFYVFLFFFILGALFSAGIVHSEESMPIYCKADHLEYDKGKGMIEGWGNVEIEYADARISADYIHVNIGSEELQARGNISFFSRTGKIEGDSIVYNMKSKSGIAENASTYILPLYYRGKKIKKISEQEFNIENGICTTCDLKKPHYRLQASRLNIYPQERIVALNVGLYIGSIPVFYLPVLTFPLRKGRTSWLVPSVGYSLDKGWYIQAGYNYSYRTWIYGNLFVQYMEKKGLGIGSELEHSTGRMEGTTSLYYVKDVRRDTDRYKVEFKTGAEGSNSFVYLYLVSDADFDREFGQYFGPPSNWVRRKFSSYICYSTPLGKSLNFQMDIKREESKEGTFSSFPRASLYSSSIRPCKIPLYINWSATAGNYYINENRYVFLNNWFNIIPGLMFTKIFGITSSLGIQGAYYNYDRDRFFYGYRAKIGPRFRWNGYFLSEFCYNIDSFMPEDTFAENAPVQSQYISSLISYTDRMVEFSLTGDYELISEKYIWDRFKRVRLDLLINPAGKIRFFNSTKYHLYEKTSYSLSYINWVGKYIGVKFGTQHFRDSQTELSLTGEIDFPRIDTFLGKYRFVASASFDLMNNKFDNADFILTRDLHCWNISLFYRAIKPEVWLRAEIKAFPEAGIQFHPTIF